MKTGIDILEIERISDSENFIDKIFTDKEKEYIIKHSNNKERIAGLFCAKEAIFKALDMNKIVYKEIEILHKENGKPYAIFHGNIKKYFDEQYGNSQIDISISHSKTIATAICIVDNK